MHRIVSDQTMERVDEIARRYDSDPDHNFQVTHLALMLFDELAGIHRYGGYERRLLEMAGRMHDIGWSRTVNQKHHKLSCKMILEADIPGLDRKDRLIIALVARYHTKAVPDPGKHGRFASLSQSHRKMVEWLAGILRVADALDSSHNGAVKDIKARITKKSLTLVLDAGIDMWDEIRRVRRKDSLLVKQVKRPVIYEC